MLIDQMTISAEQLCAAVGYWLDGQVFGYKATNEMQVVDVSFDHTGNAVIRLDIKPAAEEK